MTLNVHQFEFLLCKVHLKRSFDGEYKGMQREFSFMMLKQATLFFNYPILTENYVVVLISWMIGSDLCSLNDGFFLPRAHDHSTLRVLCKN